jgi:hypothetical protein
VLLEAGKFRDAGQMFAASLARQPNRARSLLGSARAASGMGNTQDAALAYTEFLSMWRESDPEIPELAEARAMAKTLRRE